MIPKYCEWMRDHASKWSSSDQSADEKIEDGGSKMEDGAGPDKAGPANSG